MALNRIVAMLHMIDMLHYTIVSDSWGMGSISLIS